MSRKSFKVFLGAIFILGCLGLNKLYAHCDTLDGPVIQDARAALENGDVTPVLKWVKKDAESKIRAAFKTALDERKTNKETADIQFFETLVRVHRSGEGAGFSGLKPAGSVEPIIAEADKALETGSVDELTNEMARDFTHGVKERFEPALKAKKHKDESVEAGREYVEAYVNYVHYVEDIHNSVMSKGGHHEEGLAIEAKDRQ